MKAWAWLGRRLGPARIGRGVAAVAAVLLLVGGGLLAAVLAPDAAPWLRGQRVALRSVEVAGDGDHDGLADAQENLVGSQVATFDTLGSGVPDGWLFHWYGQAIDWNSTSLLSLRVLVPPAGALPEPLAEQGLRLPTLKGLYDAQNASAAEDGYTGAWWLVRPAADPRQWDGNGDGIADAWLLQHGIDPFSVKPGDDAPGDPAMTVREKYDEGLDPSRPDSDGDGLADGQELAGSARFGSDSRVFTPTDPRLFSQRGDGVADGFLVRLGLDPAKAGVADEVPIPQGLSVREAFNITEAHCIAAAKGPCAWADRLAKGPLVDPTVPDSLGDGVPDAWEHRDPEGLVHPLRDSRDVDVDDSEEWDGSPWPGDGAPLSGVVVDSLNPPPEAPFSLSAADSYAYLRPGNWSETLDGPWWQGLPTRLEGDSGALPASVALRGWLVEIDAGLGGATDPRVLNVSADPRLADTDGDNVTDLQEYFGVELGARTDPSNPDTDRDGLGDERETKVYHTKPTKHDTSGNYLPDGAKEKLWLAKYDAALQLREEDPAGFLEEYAWLQRSGAIDVETLRPERTIGWLHPGEGDEVPVSNILAADADGDGLLDGAEVNPAYLLADGSKPRNPTDPARVDTDGDGLPDDWEVSWSKVLYYGCANCDGIYDTAEWPIDPSQVLSVPDAASSSVDDDSKVNLSDDRLASVTPARLSSSRLAYQYDLNPYTKDMDGDGLPNLFEIHWGIEQVPSDLADEVGTALPWSMSARESLATALAGRRFPAGLQDSPPFPAPPEDVIVLDPLSAAGGITSATNLRGAIGERSKGTWVHSYDRSSCEATRLPSAADGPERYEEAPRAGLVGCWDWFDYPLALDVDAGLGAGNPWMNDTDGDGLPDAWERHYGLESVVASARTETSVLSNCDAGGDDLCITYLDAYEHGLDPNAAQVAAGIIHYGDTDRGSQPDWFEIAHGMDPLDDADDFGEEDWDLDGILNRFEAQEGIDPVFPDSDRDGLADGTNVCIDPDGTTTLPPLAHRPNDWDTSQEIYDNVYADSGLLREADSDDCLPGETLFLGEGRRSLIDGKIYGAGGGTSPRNGDTGSDGLPDGWLVYWRERAPSDATEQALNPTRAVGEAGRDLDNDLLPIQAEYAMGRPADWTESRDGPWWGGSSPLDEDSDGDRAWFKTGLQANDNLDADLDNDGVGAGDTNPFGPGDQRPYRWDDAKARYVVDDPAALFALVDGRTGGALEDSDVPADQVPDFLDRARVRVVLDSVPALLEKGEDFLVSGQVLLDEAAADGVDYTDLESGADVATGAAAVQGATVVAYLRVAGREEPVAAGFTDSDGRFLLSGKTGTGISVPGPAVRSAVLGRLLDPAQATSAPSRSGELAPGPAQLVVAVEANPLYQDLVFRDGDGSHAAARAHKTMSQAGYTPPGGMPLRALYVEQGAPKVSLTESVRHAAQDVFPARSATASLTLQTRADLELGDLPDGIFLGSDLVVTGRLLDAGKPLNLKQVLVRLDAEGGVVEDTPTTGIDGVFVTELRTEGLALGDAVLTVSVAATGNPALKPPSDVVHLMEIQTESAWHGIRVNSDDVLAGEETKVDATTSFEVTGRLKDHLSLPLPGRDAVVRITDSRGNEVAREPVHTDDDGIFLASVLLASPEASARFDLSIAAEPADFDVHRPFLAHVGAAYPTRLVVDSVRLPAGAEGNITGQLLRYGGVPVHSSAVEFEYSSSQGLAGTVTGTNSTGVFRVPVPASTQANVTWSIRFARGEGLLPTPLAETYSLHVLPTALALAGAEATVGEPFAVSGALRSADGLAVTSGEVTGRWVGQNATAVLATPDRNGRFTLALPPPPTPGKRTWEALYSGPETLGVSSARAETQVRHAAVLDLDLPGAPIRPDGRSDSPLLEGTLATRDGAPLVGRAVRIALEFPAEGGPLQDALRLTPDGLHAFGSTVLAEDGDARLEPAPVPAGRSLLLADRDGDGVHDAGDGVYLAAGGTVRPGDLRLAGPGGLAGRRVDGSDHDIGWALGAAVLPRFADADRDGHYDVGESAYVDVDGNAAVSKRDVRLVPAGGEAASTRVAAKAPDLGTSLARVLPGEAVQRGGDDGFAYQSAPLYWRTRPAGDRGLGSVLEVVTDDRGRLSVPASPALNLTRAGTLRVEASFPGGLQEHATVLIEESVLVQEAALTLTRMPARAEPGHAFVIEGLVSTLAQSSEPVEVLARLGNQIVGRTLADAGGPWRIEATLPPTAGPEATLAFEGIPPPGFRILPTEAPLGRLDPVGVRLDEETQEDGSRAVRVALTGEDSLPLRRADVEVEIVRTSPSGRFLGSHRVLTDGEGVAILLLDAGQSGDLAAASFDEPTLYVSASDYHPEATVVPLFEPGGLPAWAVPTGVVLLLLAAGGLTAWLLWRRSQRLSLGTEAAAQRKLLLDRRIAPEEAIRRVYRHLLDLMVAAGYALTKEQTARDIAEQATTAFALPRPAMRSMTELFEAATYSGRGMARMDRNRALEALDALALQVDRSGNRGKAA